jgi:hypothetical protein
MNEAEALQTLRMLADGRHPFTGDALPDESCYQSAKVLRALLVGIDAMEQATKRKDRVLPAGAGRPWDADEDQSLVANFESCTSIADLAKNHQRTEGAIRSLFLPDALLPLLMTVFRPPSFAPLRPPASLCEIHA